MLRFLPLNRAPFFRAWWLLAATSLLACAAAREPQTATPNTSQEAPRVTNESAQASAPGPQIVDWRLSLSPDGARLHIEYTVENRTSARWYVADELLTVKNNAFVRAGAAIIVVNGATPGTVRFVRGAISPDVPITVLYRPMFRALEPGQRMTGTADTDFPLKSWHNLARVHPLAGTPTTAVLELHSFTGEPEWQDLPGADGKPVRVPRAYTPVIVTSSPSPLPTR